MIGQSPTIRQSYASEHIGILAKTAERLERIIFDLNPTDDHAHDLRIRKTYKTLEHDIYFARKTFDDLIYVNISLDDHNEDYQRLDALLMRAEDLTREIRINRPLPENP